MEWTGDWHHSTLWCGSGIGGYPRDDFAGHCYGQVGTSKYVKNSSNYQCKKKSCKTKTILLRSPPKKNATFFFLIYTFWLFKKGLVFFCSSDSIFSRIPGRPGSGWATGTHFGGVAWKPSRIVESPQDTSRNPWILLRSLRFGTSGFEAPSWRVKHLCLFISFLLQEAIHTSQASCTVNSSSQVLRSCRMTILNLYVTTGICTPSLNTVVVIPVLPTSTHSTEKGTSLPKIERKKLTTTWFPARTPTN